MENFYNFFQLSADRIANLNDEQLNKIMASLLIAEAHIQKSPIDQIRTNTEIKASDDGCDGWTSKPENKEGFLGSTDTCWQFKAGVAGEPERLRGEVIKKIPKETLLSGGRFVIIASGSTNGKKGEYARKEKVKLEADEAGIPSDNIDVIGSEGLANWCNRYPSIVLQIKDIQNDVWNFEKWSRSEIHQVPWHGSKKSESDIRILREAIDFSSGNILHLHIHGQPGVGKTRFALELCRDANWRSFVIYMRHPNIPLLEEIINNVSLDSRYRLMMIVDEVQTDSLDYIRELVGYGEGRVRIITIGNEKAIDTSRTNNYQIFPLEQIDMIETIRKWFPALPYEHRDFIASFSCGILKLAWLSVNIIITEPISDIHDLFSNPSIYSFLDRLLNEEDRRVLHVVAVLTVVGWCDDKAIEGKTVAENLHLDWEEVRYFIERVDKRLKIVPLLGRYRKITPNILGNYLAIEAWEIYADVLSNFPKILPTDESRNAFFSRVQLIISDPNVKKFAKQELAKTLLLVDLSNPQIVKQISAISTADPHMAARYFLGKLERTTIYDRKNISADNRRTMVNTLSKLSWFSSAFHDAAKSLALLAEAETEPWSNNATGEFVALYQIILGRTTVPFIDRLAIIDELIESRSLLIIKLVINALSSIGQDTWYRWGELPVTNTSETEWRPGSEDEFANCIIEAINRIKTISRMGISEIQDELISTADKISLMLRISNYRTAISELLLQIKEAYPNTREPLRRIIAHVIRREKEFYKEISSSDLGELEKLHNCFQDTSIEGLLYQFVGPAWWDPKEYPDLSSLAEEFLASPDTLAQHWPWLTSGEAESGWLLGETLGKIDHEGKLALCMPIFSNTGHDYRLLCSYIKIQWEINGDEWFSGWLTYQYEKLSEQTDLFFEIAWRCGANEKLLLIMSEKIKQYPVDQFIVGKLVYGRWFEEQPIELLEKFLYVLIETNHLETAIGILSNRLKYHPEEKDYWISLSLRLVTSVDLIRSNMMTNYYWKQIASIILMEHSKEIITSIINAHSHRKSTGWMLEFSEIIPILNKAFEINPKDAWQILKVHLSDFNAPSFVFGFPKGLVNKLSIDEVVLWLSESPTNRLEVFTELLYLNFDSDTNMASQLIEHFYINEEIGSIFFSTLIVGMWEGPASSHWDEIGKMLSDVQKRTNLKNLRNWTAYAINKLHEMSEREHKREEEDKVRGLR